MNKLNIVHFTSIIIEDIEYELRFGGSDIYSVLFDNFFEIINIHKALLIDVDFLERFFEEQETSSSFWHKLSSDSKENKINLSALVLSQRMMISLFVIYSNSNFITFWSGWSLFLNHLVLSWFNLSSSRFFVEISCLQRNSVWWFLLVQRRSLTEVFVIILSPWASTFSLRFDGRRIIRKYFQYLCSKVLIIFKVHSDKSKKVLEVFWSEYAIINSLELTIQVYSLFHIFNW